MTLWDSESHPASAIEVGYMNPWDLEPEDLIRAATAGNYGLGPARWTRQLEEIRALPETPKESTDA